MGRIIAARCNKCKYEKDYYVQGGLNSFVHLDNKKVQNYIKVFGLSKDKSEILKTFVSKQMKSDNNYCGSRTSSLYYCDCDNEIVNIKSVEFSIRDDNEVIRINPSSHLMSYYICDTNQGLRIGRFKCRKCNELLKEVDMDSSYRCSECLTGKNMKIRYNGFWD